MTCDCDEPDELQHKRLLASALIASGMAANPAYYASNAPPRIATDAVRIADALLGELRATARGAAMAETGVDHG